jgi:nucleoside-diphosphate-sugar epimerase
MKRCLITGATGVIGPSVVKAFQDAGYAVRVFARKPVENLEFVVGDLVDAPLTEATRDVDVVVHLAALLHENAGDYERVNVEGTRRLLDAAIASGVRRFVFASSIAVYGPGKGEMIDETTPPAPDTPYARSKLAAEQIVLKSPIGVVLRLAAVYGPRLKGNYRSLISAVRRGQYFPVGRERNRRTLIHEFDVGRAFVLAAENDSVLRSVFNVTDGDVHTLGEIVAAIATALGKKPPRLRLPVLPVRAAAMVADLVVASRKVGALLDKYLEDLAVDGGRFQRVTGFQPRMDLRSGWETTIRAVQDADAR